MTRSPWLDKPTITGERVTLRPFRDEDLVVMWAAIRDPEVRRLTGSFNTTTETEHADDDEATIREWYSSRNDRDERLDLAVVDNATGQCVGEVVLNQFDPDNESCNFRILIGPDGRDRRGQRGHPAVGRLRVLQPAAAPGRPRRLRVQPARSAHLREGRLHHQRTRLGYRVD